MRFMTMSDYLVIFMTMSDYLLRYNDIYDDVRLFSEI